MVKQKPLPIHPFLFALYPVLYLYAKNLVYIEFIHILRSLTISTAFCIFFFLSLWVISKDRAKSAMLTSLILILFFSYGHVANGIQSRLMDLNFDFPLRWLSLAWLVVFLVTSYIIVQYKDPGNTTRLLNMISLTLILFPAYSIIKANSVSSRVSSDDVMKLAEIRGEATAEADLGVLPGQELPDIYYIIFDGYVRSDMLAAHYSYDNSNFTNQLEHRGFYVVSESRSNYLNTNYSLNTSLNLLYFHNFPDSILLDAKYNLRTNYVTEFLNRFGYQLVVYDSGSDDTNAQYADIFISPHKVQDLKSGDINAFELLLMRSTMGLLLLERGQSTRSAEQPNDMFTASVNKELSLRRERIEYTFEHLPDYAGGDVPHFLFAHIYLPHIPFLYGPEGEPLRYHQDLNLFWYEVAPENYFEMYTYQVDILNALTLEMIDRILQASKRPVVIILQSDHGDELFLDYEEPDQLGVDVRSAILNAIYYSDQNYETLYDSLTPVNTFRLLFNHWFGTKYPLLPDEVFIHEHPLSTPKNTIPDFMDACDEVGICMP